MIEARQRAYLEAMGFDVWVAKPPPPDWSRLVIGPGDGSTLLVCSAAENCSTALAGDITRALGNNPAWAWPDPDPNMGTPLEDAIENRLFTRLVVFGEDLAGKMFGKDVPAVMASSSISIAPGLDELAVRGTAKQALWRIISSDAKAEG